MIHLISNNILTTPYRLVSWFPEARLDMYNACENPNAICYIQQNIQILKDEEKKEDYIMKLCRNTNKDVFKILIRYFKNEIIKDPSYCRIMALNKAIPYIPFLEQNFAPHYITQIPVLFENPEAYDLMIKNMNCFFDVTYIPFICSNPRCAHFIELYIHYSLLDADSWLSICMNPSCLDIIQSHLDLLQNMPDIKDIFWEYIALNTNPKAINIIKDNITFFDREDCWLSLCSNQTDEAIQLLSENLDKLDVFCFDMLCYNPKAHDLIFSLENRFDVDIELMANNPNCASIIQKNIPHIIANNQLGNLCKHQHLIHIIKDNIQHLTDDDWSILSLNPAIFEIDLLKKHQDLESIKHVLYIILYV